MWAESEYSKWCPPSGSLALGKGRSSSGMWPRLSSLASCEEWLADSQTALYDKLTGGEWEGGGREDEEDFLPRRGFLFDRCFPPPSLQLQNIYIASLECVARQQAHLLAAEPRTGTAMTSSLSRSGNVAIAILGGSASCRDWLLRGRGLFSGSTPSHLLLSSRLEGRLSCWGGDPPVGGATPGCSAEDSSDSVSMETGSSEVS